MSKQIKYKNRLGERINAFQAFFVKSYDKQIFIDKRLKIEKKYYNKKLEGLYVYIYPDENESVILNTLTEPDFKYSIIKDFEKINGYDTWKSYAYKNGVLGSDYMLEVIDSLNREIAVAGYDGNGVINFPGWKKYYMSNNIIYDTDGNIDIKYSEDSYVLFDFMEGELEISLPLDDEDRYRTSDLPFFYQVWQARLPLLTSDLMAYFMDPNILVPPANLNIV